MPKPISYEAVSPSPRTDFAESHQRFWGRLASPGTWWTGAERVAIAAETRQALHCALCDSRCAALSPHGIDGSHDRAIPSTVLPPAAIEAIHAIVRYSGQLTRQWLGTVLGDDGLAEGAYIEIVGTVVAMVSIDQFCRGIGAPLHPLPSPRPGAPSHYRPASAGPDEAWLPMVPADNSATPEADLWPAGKTGNVIRAMSLVPDEVRTLKDLSAAHYLPNELVRDPSASQGALSRPQMELLAGRVSALNGCFY